MKLGLNVFSVFLGLISSQGFAAPLVCTGLGYRPGGESIDATLTIADSAQVFPIEEGKSFPLKIDLSNNFDEVRFQCELRIGTVPFDNPEYYCEGTANLADYQVRIQTDRGRLVRGMIYKSWSTAYGGGGRERFDLDCGNATVDVEPDRSNHLVCETFEGGANAQQVRIEFLSFGANPMVAKLVELEGQRSVLDTEQEVRFTQRLGINGNFYHGLDREGHSIEVYLRATGPRVSRINYRHFEGAPLRCGG